MPGFDQEAWRGRTAWEGPALRPADVLEILNRVTTGAFPEVLDGEVAERELLRAGHAQLLREDPGIASGLSALRAAMHEDLGYRPSEASLERFLRIELEPGPWNNRFANLVSGRFSELLFERAHVEPLAECDLALKDATTARSFVDYLITGDGFELSVNVKNAGVQYAMAAEHVGLEPADTIPMATYKTFGAFEAPIPPLVYVFLVDWTLLERLRKAYWEALSAAERKAFQLFTSFKGLGRRLEDAFIEETVGVRLTDLRERIGYAQMPHDRFRAISAARCARLFYEVHERSPYVYQRRMNTDPNVHISVRGETTPFRDVISEHMATPATRARFLERLQATTTMSIPDPPL